VNYFLQDAILESVFTLNLNFNLDITKKLANSNETFYFANILYISKQLQSGLEISLNYINISGGQYINNTA
jgi:hypothetical protein